MGPSSGNSNKGTFCPASPGVPLLIIMPSVESMRAEVMTGVFNMFSSRSCTLYACPPFIRDSNSRWATPPSDERWEEFAVTMRCSASLAMNRDVPPRHMASMSTVAPIILVLTFISGYLMQYSFLLL